MELGWAAERIVIIDEDLGSSGASAVGRAGFQRLMAEVASPLARIDPPLLTKTDPPRG
jgi:hypothetical protein